MTNENKSEENQQKKLSELLLKNQNIPREW